MIPVFLPCFLIRVYDLHDHFGNSRDFPASIFPSFWCASGGEKASFYFATRLKKPTNQQGLSPSAAADPSLSTAPRNIGGAGQNKRAHLDPKRTLSGRAGNPRDAELQRVGKNYEMNHKGKVPGGNPSLLPSFCNPHSLGIVLVAKKLFTMYMKIYEVIKFHSFDEVCSYVRLHFRFLKASFL